MRTDKEAVRQNSVLTELWRERERERERENHFSQKMRTHKV